MKRYHSEETISNTMLRLRVRHLSSNLSQPPNGKVQVPMYEYLSHDPTPHDPAHPALLKRSGAEFHECQDPSGGVLRSLSLRISLSTALLSLSEAANLPSDIWEVG
jgi:hypothetical protein